MILRGNLLDCTRLLALENIRNKALGLIEKGVDDFWLEVYNNAKSQRHKVIDKAEYSNQIPK